MREQRFDMIKGVAIFLVVVGHVLTMCIREIDSAILFKIVGMVHMPLFFFISGWFSYKDGWKLPDLWFRFRQLIIPGLICMHLFYLAFPHTGLQSPFPREYSALWFSTAKYGYWYVFCLFDIMVYYALLCLIFRKIKRSWAQMVTGFGLTVILTVAVSRVYGNFITGLDLHNAPYYALPFLVGVFGRRHREVFTRIYSNQWVFAGALILGCLCFYPKVYFWEFPDIPSICMSMLGPLFNICLALVAMPLFTAWDQKAFAPDAYEFAGKWARMWAYLGRKSLSIYLFHYFFLFPLTPLQEPLKGMHTDFLPTLAVGTVVAAGAIVCALLVDWLISPSAVLKSLLAGDIRKKKK